MRNSERLEAWTEKEREAKRLPSYIKAEDAIWSFLREAEIVSQESAA
jgi:hypothetical protein